MRFAVRIAGDLDPEVAERFADVTIGADGNDTVLCGDLDQAGLHGLLERIRALGLELIDVRRPRTTRRTHDA